MKEKKYKNLHTISSDVSTKYVGIYMHSDDLCAQKTPIKMKA